MRVSILVATLRVQKTRDGRERVYGYERWTSDDPVDVATFNDSVSAQHYIDMLTRQCVFVIGTKV